MHKLGLLGCGVVADYGHAPAIVGTDGLQLFALCDPNPDALARLHARAPWTLAFTDIDAFLDCGLDAVSVTSPAPAHRANVEAAARRRLPVLCEKPLAMNDADIVAMTQIMDDAGLLFACGLCYRFAPVAQKIKALIDDRAIGDLRALRLIYNWDLHGKYEIGPDGEKFESARRIGRFTEGGPMVDCGVHQIDLARFWTGSEVVNATAAGAWIEEHDAPGHMWLHMDHENGAHTMVEISFSYAQTAREPVNLFQYELIGTDGIIRYDRDGWKFDLRNSEGTLWLPGSSEKDFAGMYRAWRDALDSGELGAMPSAHDGLIATRLARNATEALMQQHARTRNV